MAKNPRMHSFWRWWKPRMYSGATTTCPSFDSFGVDAEDDDGVLGAIIVIL